MPSTPTVAYDAHSRCPLRVGVGCRLVANNEHPESTTISIDDDPGLHYNLGRHWQRVANYQASHGMDPRRTVESSLAEFENTARRDGQGRGGLPSQRRGQHPHEPEHGDRPARPRAVLRDHGAQ